VSTVSATTWQCSFCKRRVPAALEVCRCGTGRPANALAPRQVALPWDVKAWIAFGVLMLLVGLYRMLLPPDRAPIIPLLGWSTTAETPPSPTLPAARKARR
jgi:hypothetical protein